ncbi:MAG: excinuclease ABC subunit A [Candidatus Omnitrophica bacterium CG1_02_49_10]|nr:MAG: excinuclease ABC subunit A [Candidatus Omnitrophica bacterium CG1_02_49_10]
MGDDYIYIKGAKEHNLKDIDLKLPRNSLIVITGLSGSGKSSLAFDTIYAEGQRRYVESLSAYARQFLEQLKKPDVEYIEGLSPAISIEQRSASSNPRSTVATTTEIYDYLRLLFARIGTPYCYKCSMPISSQDAGQITRHILSVYDGKMAEVMAPVVMGRKGEYARLLSDIKKEGFARVRIDGKIYNLDDKIKLDKRKAHTVDVVVDRLLVGKGSGKRLADSVETALRAGKGNITISSPGDKRKDVMFSEHNACVKCGVSYGEIAPRIFSFNSPYGACKGCDGLGTKLEIDPELLVPDKNRSIKEGAIEAWRRGGRGAIMYYSALLRELASQRGFTLDTPFKKLSKADQRAVLYGSDDFIWNKSFEGVIPSLERRFKETESDFLKHEINRYMSESSCPRCNGERLTPEALSIKIEGLNINDYVGMSVGKLHEYLETLELDERRQNIARMVLKEIKERLKFLVNVGLDYLTLDRASSTLSGGEAQRIKLATQIGSGLVGVLYILDEPSIGLHQRDNKKLLDTLYALRDMGNTLIVVEHDEETIRHADHIVDLGPGAGKNGGEIIAQGTIGDIISSRRSLTGSYLRGDLKIKSPNKRRERRGDRVIVIKKAAEHNLKNIDVEIPLGLFVCVTGVSGSGKSTLVHEILYRGLARRLYRSRERVGAHAGIEGMQYIDKVIIIDQSPIGRTPRSNPVTYTGAFTHIREVFSQVPEARVRGYKPGRFSFNVKGGRCEACQGDGIKKIEMHFLPDVYVQCEICKGKRFNEQTLEVRFKGYTISDVLNMPIGDALDLFGNIPKIREKLRTIDRVGLGYIELGQSATTLSGGEAQRVKLSAELSKRATGRTLYILDEPTTGLHFADIDKLLGVLQELVDSGNTVLIIEHNLDVIKNADYIIDLGPEGGDKGGEVVFQGPVEEALKSPNSHTANYLKKYLRRYSQGGILKA